MSRLATTILLGTLSLTACQPAPHFNAPNSPQADSQRAHKQEAEQLDPIPPAPKIGYTVADPTLLFPSDGLEAASHTIAAGSPVPILARTKNSVEIRVSIGGKVYKAWAKTDDVVEGTKEEVMEVIATRKCEEKIDRPLSGEIISGKLSEPRPRVSPNYIDDDEFLGLGLLEVYGHDDPTPPPMVDGPPIFGTNILEVQTALGSDVYVKVKNMEGVEIVGFFIHAGKQGSVSLPNGRYLIYFATGSGFSPECGRFMADMRVQKDPSSVFLDGDSRLSYSLKMTRTPLYSGYSFRPASASIEEF